MRPFTLFTALALVLGVAATATPRDTTPACYSEIECSDFSLAISIPAVVPEVLPRLTNAQRLARGLPLGRPRRLTPSRVRARDAAPSATPTVRGMIRVDRADGTDTLGYISKSPLSDAQYRYQDISLALVVNIPMSGVAESQVEVLTENSSIQGTYTHLSLVEGRDDTDASLSAGSYQYAYISGSPSSPPGSTPQNGPNAYTDATTTARTHESAVWSYNPATQQLTPQWINPDGSAAPSASFTQSTALYFGGDADAFMHRYPATVIKTIYIFVPL